MKLGLLSVPLCYLADNYEYLKNITTISQKLRFPPLNKSKQ